MKSVRLWYKKSGLAIYTSHLDMNRCFTRVVRRAEIPIWYTEGFNPKPKMVFAAPLSIGTESVCEYMDIRLTERIDEAEAVRCLNSNMTSEMQVLEAYYPERKLTELKWMSYTLLINTIDASDSLAKKCEAFLSGESVEVEKRTKNGDVNVVDIRPLIKSATAVFDDECIRISCVLSADQSAFLNPEYIIKALRGKVGILSCEDLTAESYSIMRERAYLSDMNEFR